MIQVNNLDKYYGRQVIFEKAGFTLNPGERVGLVGRNGHGKTTLFKMILGEDRPDSGCISIPNGYKIGHLSQHISFTENSVLKEACLSLPENEDDIDETYKAETILMGLGFALEDLTVNPMDLAGGYQVRLNLRRYLSPTLTFSFWTSLPIILILSLFAGLQSFCATGRRSL